MTTVMNASEFVKKLKDIATNYKTLYVMGCFGAPMNKPNQQLYIDHHEYNRGADRKKKINAATNATFGFDCVCLIKGVLWGWSGNKSARYGGASYASNGVPDINADYMINVCKNISTNFDNIEIGEAVWKPGHIGVYIGNGLCVECTPIWDDGVQITACNKPKSGYNTRVWNKHGKLPYIDYGVKPAATTPKKKSIDEIAKEVIQGKWYTGAARKSALTKAGYDYAKVQARVNELCNEPKKKSIDEIAKEVIQGKWYTGAARKSALTKAGYDYNAVQKRVNELLS